MATNKPPSRKTHVSRVYGTNKKGERIDDIYADMERMDSVESAMQVPPKDQWQALKRKFLWCDDPDKDDYDPKGNPSRKSEVLKVCDPETTDDVNDPEEWIPIRVIKSVKARGGGTRDQGQDYIDNFLNKVINEELRSGRKVQVRRVVHYDTNIDDLAQQAIDADPDRKEFVISSEFYTKDIESKDKDQYVEYEIVEKVTHKGNSQDVGGQDRQTKLLNDYLIDESEEATQKIKGEGDINPPYRADPFQNFINICWGALAVKFFRKESFAALPTLVPDTKRMALSIWFKTPQKSIDLARAEYKAWEENGGPRPPMLGVIPVMTAGPTNKMRPLGSESGVIGTTHGQNYTWVGLVLGGWVPTGSPFGGEVSIDKPTFSGSPIDIDPSYIGIDCTKDVPQLSINLVMPGSNTAEMKGSLPLGKNWSAPDMGSYFTAGPGGPTVYIDPTTGDFEIDLVSDGPLNPADNQTYDNTDSLAPFWLGKYPETYRTLPAERTGDRDIDRAQNDYVGQTVTAGHWHHLLLYVDFRSAVKASSGHIVQEALSPDHGPRVTDYTRLSGSEGTPETAGSRAASTSRMFLAFDGVNKEGRALSCYHPTGHRDKNAVLPVNGYFIATDTTFESTTRAEVRDGRIQTLHTIEAPGSYDYRPDGLPLSKGDIGFPTTKKYLDAVKEVELGECQIFLNVGLDTSKKEEVQAFITDEGKPAPLSLARELMGKKPDVLVHGSHNWKKARDTGSIAAAVFPPSPDGTYDGRIETYKPNPNLFGPQGE